jgi:hypothetical protein
MCDCHKAQPFIHIGFTGSEDGMTTRQLEVVKWLLDRGPAEFHHGDCIGADEQAHELAKAAGLRIVIHPPDNPSKRAFCTDYDEIREEKPYLARNHDIVNECEMLLATPSTAHEILRSGTWATVRYGRRAPRVDVAVIMPDGSVHLG